MTNNGVKMVVAGGFGLIMGIFGLGAAIGTTKKNRDLEHRLDTLAIRIGVAVDKITDEVVDIQVSDAMVAQALKRAIDREVGNVAKKAVWTVENEFKVSVRNQVRDAVNVSHDDIRAMIMSELNRALSEIDIRKFQKEAIEDLRKTAMEQMDSKI